MGVNEATRHARRLKLIDLLNELELNAYDHQDPRSMDRILEVRLKIIGLFESLEPKEEP